MVIPEAVRSLDRDLRAIFGNRLQSLVLFAGTERRSGAPVPTMAVVDVLAAEDLSSCAAHVDEWHESGLATPLLVESSEFGRSLDVFTLEFGAILAEHIVVSGTNPFHGVRVDPTDLRRACERQARSHLLHLREGYLETAGRGDRLASLILRSAPPLAALVRSVSRLHRPAQTEGAGVDASSEAAARQVESIATLGAGALAEVARLADGGSLSSDQARRIFPRYLEAVDKLTNFIDRWETA